MTTKTYNLVNATVTVERWVSDFSGPHTQQWQANVRINGIRLIGYGATEEEARAQAEDRLLHYLSEFGPDAKLVEKEQP